MKKICTILVALLCAIGSLAYNPLPRIYEGSMMPYDFDSEEPVSWPDSLKPSYCAYVARHGARYMTGSRKIKHLLTTLQEADKAGNLTEKGTRLLAMADSVVSMSEGRWGELSAVGVAEQRRLGTQMVSMFPDLNKGTSVINTISTYVPRSMLTMYEFDHAMMLRNNHLLVNTRSGREFSKLLYFFAADSAYSAYRKNGDWEPVYDEFALRKLPEAPVRSLFKSVRKIDRNTRLSLMMEFYSLLQSRQAIGLSAPSDYWMTAGEYRDCWLVTNLYHYLRNNITPLMSNVCAMATAPLLSTLINDIDTAAAFKGDAESQPRFNGYFGHAETLLPLTSLMRLPGCHALPLDWDKLADTWQLQNITPMAANIAIFLLDSPSGTKYAAVRLNGRNLEPMKDMGYVVRWDDLRQYWTQIMAAYQLHLQ